MKQAVVAVLVEIELVQIGLEWLVMQKDKDEARGMKEGERERKEEEGEKREKEKKEEHFSAFLNEATDSYELARCIQLYAG